MNNNKAGCLVLIVFALLFALFALWTDRTLDFWCSYIGERSIDVPYWLSFLASVVGNGVMFILNIISEIARLIMGA